MRVGKDKNNQELRLGDICKFTIKGKEYEGMIIYEEDYFAYAFEMLDDNFPVVLMSKADLGSIEKIINVWSTNINDPTYAEYRKLIVE
jgi:hypothetical protein